MLASARLLDDAAEGGRPISAASSMLIHRYPHVLLPVDSPSEEL